MLLWLLLIPAVVFGQANADPEPQPVQVEPAGPDRPPGDAVVLFNGRDMAGWVTVHEGQPAGCQVESGEMICVSGVGDIRTTEEFSNAQIHLEFSPPPMPDQKGQLKGNSGVYLQGRYEIQMLDSHGNPTYGHGSVGGLYGQAAPLVNASRPAGEWQSYDMIFHGPRCDAEGVVTQKATVTVLLNGLLVQDHVAIDASEKLGAGCGPGPLQLQDHSGFPNAPITRMRFRNIWMRRLAAK